MRFFLIILLSSILIINPIFSEAGESGVYLTEGIFGYVLNVDNPSSSVGDKTALFSETGLGYVFESGIYVGGVYNYSLQQQRTYDSIGESTNHVVTYQYYGPSLGFMGESWFVAGHYFLNAGRRDSVSGTAVIPYTADDSGYGFGASLGYRFSIFQGLQLGPLVSWKSVTYINCKNVVTGVTSACEPRIQQNEVIPYVTFFFDFK